MIQILEAISIALSAIWASKLRSFMTVLGNVVAVASIIAVVSLVQGINASVKDAVVSFLSVDTFSVTRAPFTTKEEDRDRMWRNPRVTARDAAALRTAGTEVTAVMSEIRSSGEVRYRDRVISSVEIRGVSREYLGFSGFDVVTGRGPTPSEIDRKQSVAILGADVANDLFKGAEPLDKVITIAGGHFRVVGVQARKGTVFGMSQDKFVVVPLPALQKITGYRQSIMVTARVSDPLKMQLAMDQGTVALRIAATPPADAARQLRPAHLRDAAEHVAGHLEPHLLGADRHRGAVARRRRHRHHEHHADGGQRAHERDWPEEGARRETPRHHVADPDRVGHAVDRRRGRRDVDRASPRRSPWRHSRRCRRRSESGRWGSASA